MRLIQSYVGVFPLHIVLEKCDILHSCYTRFKSVDVANPEKQVVLIARHGRVRHIRYEVINQQTTSRFHTVIQPCYLVCDCPHGITRDILS